MTDAGLAARAAKLWLSREREAGGVAGLHCRAGLRRCRRLDRAALAAGGGVARRFWCSEVKVDGVVYDA